jgi:ABC-type polysaccharide/polyol phosphate export permease
MDQPLIRLLSQVFGSMEMVIYPLTRIFYKVKMTKRKLQECLDTDIFSLGGYCS